MRRKSVWKAAGVLVTMLILCEIILPSSWKMTARGISLLSSILYFLWLNRKAIAVRWSKRNEKKQSRKIQEAIVQRLVASSNTPVSLFFGVPTNQKAGKEPKEQPLQQPQKL